MAAAADEFVVIVDSTKLVEPHRLARPLELLAFGLAATLRALGPSRSARHHATPDGGVLADYLGEVDDPAALAARLSATPGVVGHGLFAPSLVGRVLVGRGDSATCLTPGGSS